MSAYEKLDRPEARQWIFAPQRLPRTSLPAGAIECHWPVAPEISLGCRLYPAAQDDPVIVYFHGNGETVADYDSIAPSYNREGMSLLVTTYRGYGWSDGQPSVSAMFSDAALLLEETIALMAAREMTGPLFVMGRSLGSAPAIDLVRLEQKRVKGLIIESGFSDTLPLARNFGIDVDSSGLREEECFNNCPKIAEITLPTLILHGAVDTTIPVALAEKLQACSGARNKQFLIIPRAAHNTMIETAGPLYFQTIRRFIDGVSGASDWRRRRRTFKQQREQQ